ncbi:MAG: class I SAM-dependent methyltransferase [Candidatus Ventricola sp.]
MEGAQQQYATADTLRKRISIHEKYSVNRQDFKDWIFEHYELTPGMRILELGCGNAAMWKNHIGELPEGCELLLTDCSAGMLAEARRQLGERANVRYAQVDAMEIPYEAHSFDAVIANMMLYHVPDIDRALAQIRRVLRPDGWFACATNGERGMGSFLAEVFADFEAAEKIQAVTTRFSLENGAQKLGRHFGSVRMLGRDDALDVTDAEDLVDYVLSLASMAQLRGIPRAQIRERFLNRMSDGHLVIPKDYGMFICAGE